MISINENKYYVYHWIRQDINEPFYVGKGSGKRYKETKNGSRNQWFFNIINKYQCYPQIIYPNLSQEDAFKKQIQIQKYYRQCGYQLCNLIPCGSAPPHGSGQQNSNYGNKWSDQKKKEVSQHMKQTKCHAGQKNGRCKPVMCVQTGKIYNYMTQAAQQLNIKCIWSIGRCLKNKHFVCRGLHFVSQQLFEQLNTKQKREQYLNSIDSNSRIIQ